MALFLPTISVSKHQCVSKDDIVINNGAGIELEIIRTTKQIMSVSCIFGLTPETDTTDQSLSMHCSKRWMKLQKSFDWRKRRTGKELRHM